jgi:hypothetical protein
VSRWLCPCGEVISTSKYPNPIVWLAISDAAFDVEGSIDRQALYRQTISLYRCPVSDHLFAFWHGFDAPAITYAPIAPVVQAPPEPPVT